MIDQARLRLLEGRDRWDRSLLRSSLSLFLSLSLSLSGKHLCLQSFIKKKRVRSYVTMLHNRRRMMDDDDDDDEKE